MDVSLDFGNLHLDREVALPLAGWATRVEADRPQFVYTSIESEFPGLIQFQAEASNGWRITMREPDGEAEYVSQTLVSTSALRHACEEFLRRLGPEIRPFFDPADYLKGPELLLLRRFWS